MCGERVTARERKRERSQNVKRVNRRVWVIQKFYVDIWPQVYWPNTLTLSSAQGRWPEGMMNRSSSASATDLMPHHTLQLSAKGALNVSTCASS